MLPARCSPPGPGPPGPRQPVELSSVGWRPCWGRASQSHPQSPCLQLPRSHGLLHSLFPSGFIFLLPQEHLLEVCLVSVHNLILCLPGIIVSLNDSNLLRRECLFLPRPLSPLLFSVKISFLSSNPFSFHSPQTFIFSYNFLLYI